MRWILAAHLIFIICWFAGLFYLPRLFVYHSDSSDSISNERFKTMEQKLFFNIMTPAGILASGFGIWLLVLNWSTYVHEKWMYFKLGLVLALWVYHLFCGRYLFFFKQDCNPHSHRFYRWFNEIPTILLIAIILVAIIKL